MCTTFLNAGNRAILVARMVRIKPSLDSASRPQRLTPTDDEARMVGVFLRRNKGMSGELMPRLHRARCPDGERRLYSDLDVY